MDAIENATFIIIFLNFVEFTYFYEFSDFLSSRNSSTEQIANSQFKQIQLSYHCLLTLFFQALAFLIPGIHLDPEGISSPSPN